MSGNELPTEMLNVKYHLTNHLSKPFPEVCIILNVKSSQDYLYSPISNMSKGSTGTQSHCFFILIMKWIGYWIKRSGNVGINFSLLWFIRQLPESTNCLTCSEDGRYLSLGHSQGLSVWCASSLICVAKWLQDTLEITSIQMTRMAEAAYLLGTVDDMGG